MNILAAASLARYLKMSMEQIAERIHELKPVEHRLELIKGAVTVLTMHLTQIPKGLRLRLKYLKNLRLREE